MFFSRHLPTNLCGTEIVILHLVIMDRGSVGTDKYSNTSFSKLAKLKFIGSQLKIHGPTELLKGSIPPSALDTVIQFSYKTKHYYWSS